MMKNFILLFLMIAATSSFSKVIKPKPGQKLNFRFEIPKKETRRSLASDKEQVSPQKTKQPNQADTEETNPRKGIDFWKF